MKGMEIAAISLRSGPLRQLEFLFLDTELRGRHMQLNERQ